MHRDITACSNVGVQNSRGLLLLGHPRSPAGHQEVEGNSQKIHASSDTGQNTVGVRESAAVYHGGNPDSHAESVMVADIQFKSLDLRKVKDITHETRFLPPTTITSAAPALCVMASTALD